MDLENFYKKYNSTQAEVCRAKLAHRTPQMSILPWRPKYLTIHKGKAKRFYDESEPVPASTEITSVILRGYGLAPGVMISKLFQEIRIKDRASEISDAVL
jgi:hypothetical protein